MLHKLNAQALRMRRKITIFTIILQLRVPCVCVCECVTIWIIKCTFYALFSALHFQQISFTLLHFKLTTSKGAQGGGVVRWRLVARRARDIQFGLGEIQKKKTHTTEKRDENCKRGTFKNARILFNLTVCPCVCPCVCVYKSTGVPRKIKAHD